MIEIKAKSACAGLLPITFGTLVLAEVEARPMWSISPFQGRETDCVAALKAVGIAWPNVGTCTKNAAWIGLDQVMIFADSLPDLPAAVTDQSDAWASVSVMGDAQAVLARLVPVDLRLPVGAVVRTLVRYMTAHITCRADDHFEIMVMRSMAQTLVHDLTAAAQAVAARG